jgi:hypothetical protein
LSEQTSGRLTGRKLLLLRLVWAIAAAGCIFLYLGDVLTTAQGVQKAELPWWEIALATYYLLLGLLIFWQRSDDWVAFLLSLTFMLFLTTNVVQAIFGPGPLAAWIDNLLAATASAISGCLFYVFPDGRFTPRWTRWAAVAVVGVALWRVFFAEAYDAYGFRLVGLLFVTAPIAQFYRYRQVADPQQRQQIKWVVYGLIVAVPPVAAALLIYSLAGETYASTFELIGLLAWTFFLVVFPLSFTVSILRYRLFDIDIIIRKTLVYGVLSGLLALVYFGSVILLQTLFGPATEDSPLLIVLSTLLIAALFSTLRRRVQRFIDRRFYRSKYDAARTLAEFAQHARDEVELEALSAELVRVVGETMQPEQVSVWLKTQIRASK